MLSPAGGALNFPGMTRKCSLAMCLAKEVSQNLEATLLITTINSLMKTVIVVTGENSEDYAHFSEKVIQAILLTCTG